MIIEKNVNGVSISNEQNGLDHVWAGLAHLNLNTIIMEVHL